jgi:hypothetical protein
MKNTDSDFTGAAVAETKTATKNGSRLQRGSEGGEAVACLRYVA